MLRYIDGTVDGVKKLDTPIRWEQTLLILGRALKLEPLADSKLELGLRDVIHQMKQKGVFRSFTTNGKEIPSLDSLLNREQMASLLVQAFGFNNSKQNVSYED